MRRILLSMVAGAAILALSAGSATALVVPGAQDQIQTGHTDAANAASTMALAQTFTAGVTGSLTAVGIYVNELAVPAVVGPAAATPPPGSNVEVYVAATSSDVPSGGPLAGPIFATLGTTPDWIYFIFDTPAPITSGTKYAIIVLPLGSGQAVWGGECSDAYTGGQALANDSSWQDVPTATGDDLCVEDFAFVTYVSTSTPPPTASAQAAANGSASSALPIVIASLSVAAAAAFVLRRRHGVARP